LRHLAKRAMPRWTSQKSFVTLSGVGWSNGAERARVLTPRWRSYSRKALRSLSQKQFNWQQQTTNGKTLKSRTLRSNTHNFHFEILRRSRPLRNGSKISRVLWSPAVLASSAMAGNIEASSNIDQRRRHLDCQSWQ
jgi:hypothetical protein